MISGPHVESALNLDLRSAALTRISLPAVSSSQFHIPAEPDIHAEVGAYCLRAARSRDDREAACRLRFRVFNVELGKGLESSYETGLDTDRFDAVCEHLVVEEKATGRIVGTYRMQSGTTAAAHLGYYSAREFELGPYEPLRPGILELGRAAIDRAHRTPEVLTLLWRGIAQYAHGMGLRYLLGCSSLNSVDPAEGWQMYSLLQNFKVSPEFETIPAAAYACPNEPQAASAQTFACTATLESAAPEHTSPAAPQVKVPKLLRTYLAIGARIAAPPAFDREFRTIDFLTLLDLEMLSPAARNRFLAPLAS